MEIVFGIAGLLLGGSVAWFARGGRARETQARLETELRILSEARVAAEATLEGTRAENRTLIAVQANLQSRLEEHRRTAEEKLALVTDAQQKLSDAFRAMSADALKTNNQQFLDLAQETLSRFHAGATHDLDARRKAIDEIVKPLAESLAKVDGKIHDIEVARASAYSTLTEQVKSMMATQAQLQTETGSLVRALRAPATRGRWGELQLRRVVEMAGMVEYCDFRQQQTVITEDGRLRPDMVIQCPGNRRVVLDSKVSLAAYLDAAECADESQRIAYLKSHAAQVRAHVTRLGTKAYWAQFESAPDFVVAFLPGETFFSAALEQDPELIEFGVQQNVILATPTTLIALLRSVAYGWRQEKLAENARDISELGRQVYERLGTLAEHFSKVGLNLDRAMKSYNDAVGTLETRVLVSARKLKERGATIEEDLPELQPFDRVAREIASPDLMQVEHRTVPWFDEPAREECYVEPAGINGSVHQGR